MSLSGTRLPSPVRYTKMPLSGATRIFHCIIRFESDLSRVKYGLPTNVYDRLSSEITVALRFYSGYTFILQVQFALTDNGCTGNNLFFTERKMSNAQDEMYIRNRRQFCY